MMIRKECCWILSNIAACEIEDTQSIIDRKSMLVKLGVMLINDYEDVQKEIAYLFGNLCRTSKDT